MDPGTLAKSLYLARTRITNLKERLDEAGRKKQLALNSEAVARHALISKSYYCAVIGLSSTVHVEIPTPILLAMTRKTVEEADAELQKVTAEVQAEYEKLLK